MRQESEQDGQRLDQRRPPAPAMTRENGNAAHILALQRAAGNGAVSRLLEGQPVVQRKLTFGQANQQEVRDVAHLKALIPQGSSPTHDEALFGLTTMGSYPKDMKKPNKRQERVNYLAKLVDTLPRVIENSKMYVAKTARDLRDVVRDFATLQDKNNATLRVVVPAAGGELDADEKRRIPKEAQDLFAFLKKSGRVFSYDNLLDLAAKAKSSTGWIYELELAAEALKEPKALVQISSLGVSQIESELKRLGNGAEPAAHEKVENAKYGGDISVWRPIPRADGATGPVQYGATFTQAKKVKFENLSDHLKAAANQLKGLTASGSGGTNSDREMNFVGDDYRGEIAIQITDDIGDMRNIEGQARGFLSGKVVSRIIIWGPTGEVAFDSGQRA
ncbi:hypothetical protein [Actinoplanes sp. NPDC049265]|uniref:hypothetical protein n=1 Tax=Actinoplanes sp. NPDC049265 TaxID=3363902 RepID=UPI0037100D77